MDVFNNHVFTIVENPTLSINHSGISFTPSACSRARVGRYVTRCSIYFLQGLELISQKWYK